MVRATGGESSPVKERTKARRNRIFASKSIDGKKSMRAEVNVGNGKFAERREIHPHFCRVFRGRDRFSRYGWGDGGAGGVLTCEGAEGTARAFGGAGVVGVFGSAERSAMIFSVAVLLTAQAESQIRHCASVNLHPQVQVSALK